MKNRKLRATLVHCARPLAFILALQQPALVNAMTLVSQPLPSEDSGGGGGLDFGGGGSSCPVEKVNDFRLPNNAKVYVGLQDKLKDLPSNGGKTPVQQITDAIAAWNAENKQNGTNIEFILSDDPRSIDATDANVYVVVNNATTIDSPTGPEAAPGARTRAEVEDGNPITTRADIVFFPNASSPYGPYYDASKAGYDSVFFKAMLHELGHLMGLGDIAPAEQVGGTSVMNGFTSTNDQKNNIAGAVTQCDRDQVKVSFQQIQPSDQGGGGGGGDNSGDDGSGGGWDGWDPWAFIDIPTCVNYCSAGDGGRDGGGGGWSVDHYIYW